MQGQGNSVESFAETFEFDRGSAMGNPGMDHQVYLNDSLRGPVETQTLQEYRLSSGDTNMPYANATSQDGASLNMWNSSASRSEEQTQNLDNHDETKMEHVWTVSLTGNGGGAPRNEEGRFEASNMRSTESVNINLSNHHLDNNLPFSQSSHSNDFPQNFGHNIGYVGTSNQTLVAGLCPPYNPGLSESKRVLSSGGSSNACESSSRRVGSSSEEDGGRQGDSLDGWHLPCKRKNIEGLPEQASASGSSTWFRQSESSYDHVSSHYDDDASLNISRSSEFVSDLSPAQPDSRIGTNAGIMGSDSGNAERSRRSLRIRINPTNQHGLSPPPWVPVNRTAQQFSLPIPSAESLESGPVVTSSNSENQFYVPVTLQLPRNVQPENGASSSRLGSSPSNPIIVGERSAVTSEETNIRSMLSSNSLDQPAFRVETETRQSAAVPPNWDLANGGTAIPVTVAPASLTATSSVVHQPLGSTAPPHHAHHRRRLSEIRQLLTTLGSSASGQGVNSPQRSLQPVTSQDVERPSGAGIQGYRLDYVRSAIMDSQRDGVPGIPVFVRPAAASREQRSRMISEIRHVLDLMRRGDNLQPEDVHLFDRYPYFGGGADLLDRHRDMRLDVDNMSYEELLALEERIGDVSTGLSEETVLKCLKQRKYVSITVEASAEVEPCCICQEEYIDGQEVGIPDCEHEFHTDCIKQWLMQKNICPICKTTALAATSRGEGDVLQPESEEALDDE